MYLTSTRCIIHPGLSLYDYSNHMGFLAVHPEPGEHGVSVNSASSPLLLAVGVRVNPAADATADIVDRLITPTPLGLGL